MFLKCYHKTRYHPRIGSRGWTTLHNTFMYDTPGFENDSCELKPNRKYMCGRGDHEHYQYDTLPPYSTVDFRIFDGKKICYIGDSMTRQMRVAMCHLPSERYTNATIHFLFSHFIFDVIGCTPGQTTKKECQNATLNLDTFEKRVTSSIVHCDVVIMQTSTWWNNKLGNDRGYPTNIEYIKYAGETMNIATFIRKYDKYPLEKGLDIIYANMTKFIKEDATLYYRTEPSSPRIRKYQKRYLKNTKTFQLLDVSEVSRSAPQGIRPKHNRLGPHYCSANSIPLLWNFILARQIIYKKAWESHASESMRNSE